jgi:hypothetical protein
MTSQCIEQLKGRTVKNIFMDEDHLVFVTDEGNVGFEVGSDCCSESVFYDFYGVKNLLANGKITDVKEIELTDDDKNDKKNYQEAIEKYGYQLTTVSPEFGEVTSVFSFRNYSNGYYGGSIENGSEETSGLPEITDDVVETAKHLTPPRLSGG